MVGDLADDLADVWSDLKSGLSAIGYVQARFRVTKNLIFSLHDHRSKIVEFVINRVLSKIYGMGRGWAFSGIDFTHFGSREAVRLSLHRLEQQGRIRRVMRGVYDYPRESALLERRLSPDMDQVARALARRFGWSIQPDGATAQSILGLTTQVPAKYVYLSDGPKRSYQLNQTKLEFQHSPLKESGFRYPESALIVQAVRWQGQNRIDAEVIAKIRD